MTRKAVRVYEQRGLPPAAERTAAGYRLYDRSDVDLLVFIRQARTLGLHLDDIGAILAIRDRCDPPCAAVRDRLDDRIAEIDATIAELLALRKTLADTRERADDHAGDQSVTVCGIIELRESAETDDSIRPESGQAARSGDADLLSGGRSIADDQRSRKLLASNHSH